MFRSKTSIFSFGVHARADATAALRETAADPASDLGDGLGNAGRDLGQADGAPGAVASHRAEPATTHSESTTWIFPRIKFRVLMPFRKLIPCRFIFRFQEEPLAGVQDEPVRDL